jgi:hypothetical protein
MPLCSPRFLQSISARYLCVAMYGGIFARYLFDTRIYLLDIFVLLVKISTRYFFVCLQIHVYLVVCYTEFPLDAFVCYKEFPLDIISVFLYREFLLDISVC